MRLPAFHADDDPLLGTPVDPEAYDYRRAAWDAVHFPRLLDRYWQNLRRAVGWNVQYAGCVEPQRRLAPHAHFAIRGTIPRAMLERVAAATYHQVWWPNADAPIYPADRLPVWDDKRGRGSTPTPGPAPAWAAALDALDDDPDAEPVHVASFGPQVKAKGVNTGSATLTAPSATSPSTSPRTPTPATPSPPTRNAPTSTGSGTNCASPRARTGAPTGCSTASSRRTHTAKLRPGPCKGRVHQRATLGIGGRRVLVSRDWSGKTLADHRADAHDWVRVLLGSRRPDHVDQDQVRADAATGTRRHRSPGNSSATTTPTSPPSNTGSYAASPKPSNGANNAPPPTPAPDSAHPDMFRQPRPTRPREETQRDQ